MDRLEASRTFFASLVTANAGVGSNDRRLKAAFASVRRERFVGAGPWRVFTPIGYIETPGDDASFLYQDITIALEPKDTINNGQPTLHAFCISALGIQEGEAIAHVGAGTGYYTAVLSKMTGPAGSVHAYEIESRLAERAGRNLEDLTNTAVHSCSGSDRRLPDCDVIYVNAGATSPVPNWLDALRAGGRLLFPLTGVHNHGAMLLIKRNSASQFDARFLCRAAFIPCLGARDKRLEQALYRRLSKAKTLPQSDHFV